MPKRWTQSSSTRRTWSGVSAARGPVNALARVRTAAASASRSGCDFRVPFDRSPIVAVYRADASSPAGQVYRRARSIEMLIDTLLSIAAAAGLLTALYWGAVACHAVRTWWSIPTLRAGLQASTDIQPPRICVIVPAHNEEACIGTVAASLLSQDYPADRLSMVFVLDRCSDGTRAALDSAIGSAAGGETGESGGRVTIIENDHCPEGWAGKVHALWRAVSDSTAVREADVLLFLDADTMMDPSCIRAAAGLMRARGLGMLSVLSTLTNDKWFERIVQPAAGMELVRMFPMRRTNWPTQQRPFANGQFIMIDRVAYSGFGGHEAVRQYVLEDVELARAADRAGVRLGVVLADGLLRCRMYGTWAEFRRGWTRIFTESANRKVSRLVRIAWRKRLVSTLLPLAGAVGLLAGAAALASGHRGEPALWALRFGAAGSLVYVSTLVLCMKLGRTPLRSAAVFPIGAWMVSDILLGCARSLRAGKPIEWAGRVYNREAR